MNKHLNSAPQIIVLKLQMDWSNRTFVIVREKKDTFGPLVWKQVGQVFLKLIQTFILSQASLW
jgi:hypothetical protein